MLKIEEIKEFFNLKNTHAKKELGQNYLISEIKRDEIINALDIEENDKILEIGPGLGALTEKIVNKSIKFSVCEIDEKYVEYLNNAFNETNINVFKNNIVKFKDFDFTKVISNLPYYMTSEIIEYISSNFIDVNKCVYMMQKECFKRITATKGEDYNALNIYLNYLYNIKIVTEVKKDCFFPVPKVDSIVVEFNKKEEIDTSFARFLFKIAKFSFLNRRKTLINNLKKYYDETKIKTFLMSINKKETARAEELNFEEFQNLSSILLDK